MAADHFDVSRSLEAWKFHRQAAVGEYELGLDTLTPCWVRMVIYGTPTC